MDERDLQLMSETLQITNHVRQCSLFELRAKLEQLQRDNPVGFETVKVFLMSLSTKGNA